MNNCDVHCRVRVVGVIDLARGRAVHARAGRRDLYEPVQSVAGRRIEAGDGVALARAYVDRLGIRELYVADLDALGGGPVQRPAIAAIAAVGTPVLLDAAVTTADEARRALDLGADRVIVALETLPGFERLGQVCAAIGGEHVAFSLDLRDGAPVIASGARISAEPPQAIAAGAIAAGAGTLIVIDLGRVGTGRGVDLDLLASVRDVTQGTRLLAGGGVRGVEDLARLAEVGCDGALVATALHDGRIGAADVAAAGDYGDHKLQQ
jgi:phosphoribosylformimino-5-aminoimidazole carboxamide ribotide isomerase